MREHGGYTALFYAISNSHYEVADYLVKNGANINNIDDSGEPMIFTKCRDETNKPLDWMLSNGADPNFRNRQGATPMMIVAANNSVAKLQMLLAAGGNPKLKDFRGHDLEFWATKAGRKEVLEWLKNLKK